MSATEAPPVDEATERVTNIIHNLAGMDHEAGAKFLLRTEDPDALMAAWEHLENARRRQEIYDEWGFFTKVSLPDVKGKPREHKPKSGKIGEDTKTGDERWELIKRAHIDPETEVLNLEAAARDWLDGQLSALDMLGKLPAEYRVWASLVAWAPGSDRTVALDWQGEEVKRKLEAGEYLISLPKLVETLKEIGQPAWAAAFERLQPGAEHA